MSIMPAAEGPTPIYGTAPPDQQATGLRGLLDQAKAVIGKDGGMDQDEIAAVGEFMAWIQAMAMQGGPGGMAGGEEGQVGGGLPEGAPEDMFESRDGREDVGLMYGGR